MKLITLDQARQHVKADGDDDEMLTIYCNAAEAACARLANRGIFATSDERDTAVAGVTSMLTEAYAAYDAAVETANAQDDDRIKTMMLAQAQSALDRATVNSDHIIHSIPVDDDIIAAVLLTVGHLYRNRETVVTGQGAAAVEVPMAARHIMENYRWLGPL